MGNLDNHSRKKQDPTEEIEGRKAAELLVTLKFEQLQKPLKEQRNKKPQKLEEKVEVMLKQVPHSPGVVQIPVQMIVLSGHYVHKPSDIEIQLVEIYQRIHNNGSDIQITIGSP